MADLLDGKAGASWQARMAGSGLPGLAAHGAAAVMAAVAVFQAALVFGAPWGDYTQGGRSTGSLDAPGRVVAAVSFAVLLFLAAILLARVAEGPLRRAPRRLVTVFAWVGMVYAALAVLLNLVTQSSKERGVFAPVAVVLLILVAVAVFGTRQTD
jgi:hypothetical protein